MKTFKIWLLTIVVLLCSTTVSAHDFEVDGIYYNITSETNLTVSVTYKGSDYSSAVYSGNIIIPSSVEYNSIIYSVTVIGGSAFYGCSNLTSITIPNSVTVIGSSAFNGCSNLASFAIPNSVTSIGASVFSGCDNLTSIVVEEDNPMYDSRGNCNAIIKTATNELIRGCQFTIIPNSVTSIGSAAFYGCKDLISITIPNSVISIESSAFHNTNLPIENNIRYADTWAVEVTDKTKAKYTLRDNTIGIASGAFSYCSNLTSITIPDGVISIGNSAFWNCSNLTSITILDGVISIGNSAFYGCTKLTSITIPNSVVSVGQGAFRNSIYEA